MLNTVLIIIKYLIIILFAFFVFISFRAQRDAPSEKKKASYAFQRIFLLLIHFLAFLSIYLNVSTNPEIPVQSTSLIWFYGGQLLYLLIMIFIFPAILEFSVGFNNVMCMFIAIGFIIQTRLGFDRSLRQFIIVAVSSLIFLIVIIIGKRVHFLRNLTWVYCIVGLVMLTAVFLLSRVVYGAKLAIDIGVFSFQPSEFVKILFVLFIASAFYRSDSFKTLLITAAFAALHILLLVFCRDLGTALILFVVYEMMLYVATKNLLYIGAGLAGLSVASVAAYHMFSHVQTRIAAWLDPWTDIESKGWQIAQSLFAIGTGGWFGMGLYQGSPEDIPVVSNDMVFSAISEEMGAVFGILLIFLSLCLTLMIFRIALRVNNSFYKLIAFGLGAAYAFQVFLTIGGAIKFIPLTGVNYPLISSGGSSILASMIMCAMIQIIYAVSESDTRKERKMVMRGADISEFSGYEHLAPEEDYDDMYDEPYEDRKYRPQERRTGKWIEKIDMTEYDYDHYTEPDELYDERDMMPHGHASKAGREEPSGRSKTGKKIRHYTDRDFYDEQ